MATTPRSANRFLYDTAVLIFKPLFLWKLIGKHGIRPVYQLPAGMCRPAEVLFEMSVSAKGYGKFRWAVKAKPKESGRAVPPMTLSEWPVAATRRRPSFPVSLNRARPLRNPVAVPRRGMCRRPSGPGPWCGSARCKKETADRCAQRRGGRSGNSMCARGAMFACSGQSCLDRSCMGRLCMGRYERDVVTRSAFQNSIPA